MSKIGKKEIDRTLGFLKDVAKVDVEIVNFMRKASYKELEKDSLNIRSEFKFYNMTDQEREAVKMWETMSGNVVPFAETVEDKQGFIKVLRGALNEFDSMKDTMISEIERILNQRELEK